MTANVRLYLLLAFGISWGAYFTRQLAPLPDWLDETMRLVVKFGPSLGGILMVAATGGWRGTRELFGRLLPGGVAVRWYVIAFGAPAVIIIVAIALHVVSGSDALASASFPLPDTLLALLSLLAIRFFAGGGLGEELGWRGFMLPQLQQRHDALTASLYIGVFHGLWHLPAQGVFGTIVLTAFTTAGGIAATWMFNSTKGNVLVVALMHAAFNAYVSFSEVVAPDLDSEIGWQLWPIVMLVGVAYWLVRTKGAEDLSLVGRVKANELSAATRAGAS